MLCPALFRSVGNAVRLRLVNQLDFRAYSIKKIPNPLKWEANVPAAPGRESQCLFHLLFQNPGCDWDYWALHPKAKLCQWTARKREHLHQQQGAPAANTAALTSSALRKASSAYMPCSSFHLPALATPQANPDPVTPAGSHKPQPLKDFSPLSFLVQHRISQSNLTHFFQQRQFKLLISCLEVTV